MNISTPVVAPIVANSTEHLKELVNAEIALNGVHCDLNHIDISQLDSLCAVFQNSPFNGDISQWRTGHITDMSALFMQSQFNGDISNWDTSKLSTAIAMFRRSVFNGDISKWDTSSLFLAHYMFRESRFNGDIENWNVSKTFALTKMFQDSAFDGNIDKWDLNGSREMEGMFFNCPYKGDLSKTRLSTYGKYLRVFSPTFEGQIPLAPEGAADCKKFYTTLFGGVAGLATYLEKTPFCGVHVDLLQVAKRTPSWSNPAEHDWVRTQAGIGASLGMDTAALRSFVVAAHPNHNRRADLDANNTLDTFSVSP